MSEHEMIVAMETALEAHGIDDKLIAVGQFAPRGQSGGMSVGGLIGEAAGVAGTAAGTLGGWYVPGRAEGLPPAMLVGVSMLLLSAGAVAELLESVGTAVEFAASLTAAALAIIGVFSLLYGGAHVWASMLLRRRAPFGRVLMLELALVDLVVLPFGTALGIYALWALLTNEGRRLFEAHAV